LVERPCTTISLYVNCIKGDGQRLFDKVPVIPKLSQLFEGRLDNALLIGLPGGRVPGHLLHFIC
jgi:hypothetical protein